MNDNITCDLCGSHDYRIAYEIGNNHDTNDKVFSYTVSDPILQKPDRVVKCGNNDCALMFIPTKQEEHEIQKLYEDYVDDEYVKEEKGRRSASRIILKRIDALMQEKGKILDVGCASGFFLDEAKKVGWDVYGVEPSKWARKYAEEKEGIKILSSTLDELVFDRESFDVVVMLDVLEHVISPRKMLSIANELLKKEGILVITTPNAGSFFSKILGPRWWGIHKSHLFYFSKKTIEKLFKRAGYQKICYKGHIRIFSFRYWFFRITASSHLLNVLTKPLLTIKSIREQNLGVRIYDWMEVYARKV